MPEDRKLGRVVGMLCLTQYDVGRYQVRVWSSSGSVR